ncbi:hypothetical protein CK203_042621 [Vitis vinifera]|uniref:Retrotransposon gag domain-containing protein n=1 Tax=Vitis vinifera TaxID=29760 RepID=A0A438I7R5_VITVI|nr:hypothetical protein CK203_042621 [Vitis vinifera]
MHRLYFVFINCALIPFLDSALLFAAQGLATGYIDVREHSGEGRHFDVDWSPIIEDLYSPKLGNPLGCRGSACVEMMTPCMEAPRLFLRRADGCVLPEGTIASARDLLKSTHIHLEPPSPCYLLTHLIDILCEIDQGIGPVRPESDQRDMDSQIVTVDQFVEAMASIQEAIASLGRRIDGQQASRPSSQIEVAPPPVTVPTPTSEDPHARMDRLEQGLRQLRTSDRAITWEGFDGVPVASLPAKFRMPDIERYTGIGCPRLHLRLYSTVMRAHGLDEPQMITLFPLSLSGAAQRWFASLEASRRRTWDDLAQEFLRQFSFNTVVEYRGGSSRL